MHAHHALPPRDSALTRIRSRRSIRGDHCYCLVIEMQLPCEVRAAATAFERLAHAIPAMMFFCRPFFLSGFRVEPMKKQW